MGRLAVDPRPASPRPRVAIWKQTGAVFGVPPDRWCSYSFGFEIVVDPQQGYPQEEGCPSHKKGTPENKEPSQTPSGHGNIS